MPLPNQPTSWGSQVPPLPIKYPFYLENSATCLWCLQARLKILSQTCTYHLAGAPESCSCSKDLTLDTRTLGDTPHSPWDTIHVRQLKHPHTIFRDIPTLFSHTDIMSAGHRVSQHFIPHRPLCVLHTSILMHTFSQAPLPVLVSLLLRQSYPFAQTPERL